MHRKCLLEVRVCRVQQFCILVNFQGGDCAVSQAMILRCGMSKVVGCPLVQVLSLVFAASSLQPLWCEGSGKGKAW